MSRTKSKRFFKTGLLPNWLNEKIAVPVILLIGVIARFATITKASIWHDEGFTMMLIGRSPADIWLGSGRDVHPPLYYELLHFWTNLFGRSELAARSMSAVAGLATLFIGYLLIKRYFSKTTGYIALLILAIAPFLVRYSQEARMYGVLGLFLIAGTYSLLRAIEDQKSKKWWIIYATCMAAGMYTHYFTVLALASHWLYVMSLESPLRWRINKSLWLSPQWWLANIGIIVLWLPWLPSFYGQFSRGQGISWIPKTTLETLPKNIWQNLTFTDGGQLPPAIFWLVPLMIIISALWTGWTMRRDKPAIKLLLLYTFVPLLVTIAVSVIKPLYQDRYLVFAANGMYMVLAITMHHLIARHRTSGLAALALLIGISGVGLVNVGRQASHTMAAVGNYVDQNYRSGDTIISGELYTYFDFSYYCDRCLDTRNLQKTSNQLELKIEQPPYTTLKLNTSGGRPNGYGESALLYDRANDIYVDNLASLQPASKRVWMVGKPGDKPYWKSLPSGWNELNRFTTNSSEVRLYQLP
ncbi:glycosyltransferase family 39 protein [Candidatus Saccharibacteria bacterium]|nr:glycosyltransferase family 39 protein [Candidatus Saccharibacteria bacterium]